MRYSGWTALSRPTPGNRHRVVSATPGPCTSPEGVHVETPCGLDKLDHADTVVIPARSFPGDPPDVARVAHRSDFGSAAGLGQHFTRAVSATPLAYRRTFRP